MSNVKRVNEIEHLIAAGNLSAAQVFTQMKQLLPAAGSQQPDTTTLDQRKRALMESDPELFMAIADGGGRSDSGADAEPVAWWDGDLIEIAASFETKKTAYHTIPVYTHPAKSQGVPELIKAIADKLEEVEGVSADGGYMWDARECAEFIREEADALFATPQPATFAGRTKT